MSIIYLGVTSGVAMEIHYCMGERTGIELFHNDDEKCNRCGMTEKSGCCSEEQKFVKLSEEHKLVDNNKILFHPAAIQFPDTKVQTLPLVALKVLTDYLPPESNKPALFIIHRVFLI